MKEFKIIEISSGEIYHVFKATDFSVVEQTLEQYSCDGWEVVSVCPNHYLNNAHGDILITLQREKQ